MSEKKSSPFSNSWNFVKDSKKPLIGIGVIVGGALLYSLTTHHTPIVNKATIADAPNTTGRLGDPVSAAYQHSIDEADQKRLAAANKTGDSFMETLTPHSGNEHSLSPNLDDSAETGGGGDKTLPDLPDAQPHLAPPPVVTPPPAAPAANNTTPKAPRRYVSKERMTELQKMLAERENNNNAAEDVIYVWQAKQGNGTTQVASADQDYQSGGGHAGGGLTGGSDASLREAAMKGPSGGENSSSSGISFETPDPGTILPAHFLSLTDSRVPGMVLAVIDDGPYKGARALGKFSVASQANKLMFQFTKLVVPYDDDSGVKRAKVISINAVAVDPDTLSEGMATYVNTHMLGRVASTLATSFMQGLGQAVQQSGSTATYTASGGTIVSQGEKNLTQEMFQAGGQSASQIGSLLNQMFGSMEKTIREDQYVSFGMLFVGNNS